MADKGPGPSPLIRKRIEAEKARLEFGIISQELEMMELDDKIVRLKENIKASREEILKQERNLEALEKGEEEING